MKTSTRPGIDYTAFVGIDVSKQTLDLHLLPSGARFSCKNDPEDSSQLLTLLAEHTLDAATTLVVIEASGGYQTAAAAMLWQAGYQVAIVNPARVRAFANALGYNAKTDAIDARVLAEYARTAAPRVSPLADVQQQQLRDLAARRQQIVAMITAEKNRLGTAPQANRNSIRTVISFLQRQLEEIEGEMDTLIKSSPEYHQLDQLLQSFKGIGSKIARVLIANLSELGVLCGKKLSALVGLAPYNRDSGRFKGKRFIRGGRSDVRAALYMAAKTASRFNPAIKPFYERLVASGKSYNQALIACAHKILLILNAMVKNNQPFAPTIGN